jgi:hypothetical protein
VRTEVETRTCAVVRDYMPHAPGSRGGDGARRHGRAGAAPQKKLQPSCDGLDVDVDVDVDNAAGDAAAAAANEADEAADEAQPSPLTEVRGAPGVRIVLVPTRGDIDVPRGNGDIPLHKGPRGPGLVRK